MVFLLVQSLLACGIWWHCVRTVQRSSQLAAWCTPAFVETVKELVSSRTTRRTLARQIPLHELSNWIESETDDLLDTADLLRERMAGSPRLLRGLATLSNGIGLLFTIVQIRFAMGGSNGSASGGLVALESAVLGFCTALPCWTAVGQCRLSLRKSSSSLESLTEMLAQMPDGVDEPRLAPT